MIDLIQVLQISWFHAQRLRMNENLSFVVVGETPTSASGPFSVCQCPIVSPKSSLPTRSWTVADGVSNNVLIDMCMSHENGFEYIV